MAEDLAREGEGWASLERTDVERTDPPALDGEGIANRDGGREVEKRSPGVPGVETDRDLCGTGGSISSTEVEMVKSVACRRERSFRSLSDIEFEASELLGLATPDASWSLMNVRKAGETSSKYASNFSLPFSA